MIEPNKLLRVDHLRVRNFRCFAECELDLHSSLTVLVADNGHGKTALLDALRLALQDFVTTIGKARQSSGFARTDIRLAREGFGPMEAQVPTEFEVCGEVDGHQVAWSRVLAKASFHARTSTKDTKNFRRVVERLANAPGVNEYSTTDNPQVLPVVAYYGTGRLYDEHRLTKLKRWVAENQPIRTSAYLDCLSPSSSYKSFASWFGQKWENMVSPTSKALGFIGRPENHLAAVRHAVAQVLAPTGWTQLTWHFPEEDDDGQIFGRGFLEVEHAERGLLPLAHLSDGVRNMVALVADLSHRCVRLNPFFEDRAAQNTPGVVMIDEVDMHLHPSWQQIVVDSLQSVFPRVQFVLTTHSPQVISTVRPENVRILRRDEAGKWIADNKAPNTYGHSSSRSLEAVMGGQAYPEHLPTVADLREYQRLVGDDEHDSSRALELRAALEQVWGKHDPELQLVDISIRKNEALRKVRNQRQ